MTIQYSTLLPNFCKESGKLLTDKERHEKAMWDKVQLGDLVIWKNAGTNLPDIVFNLARSRANELGSLFQSGWIVKDMVFKFSAKAPSMHEFQPIPTKCYNPVIPSHIGSRYNEDPKVEVEQGTVSVPCTFGGDDLMEPFTTKSKYHQLPFDDKPFGYLKPKE